MDSTDTLVKVAKDSSFINKPILLYVQFLQSLHVCAFEAELRRCFLAGELDCLEDATSETPVVDDPYFGVPSADDAQVWVVTTLLKNQT